MEKDFCALLARLNKGKSLTPQEKVIASKLREHTSKVIKPRLREKGLLSALYKNVHDNTVYQANAKYALGLSSKKPFWYDKVQYSLKCLGGPKYGLQQSLTLYRVISKSEQEKFFRFDTNGTSGKMLSTKNMSCSINPFRAIGFFSNKHKDQDKDAWCCMLIIRVPKGTKYCFMPGLFATDITHQEQEVFLSAGEYDITSSSMNVTLDTGMVKCQHNVVSGEKFPKSLTFSVYEVKPSRQPLNTTQSKMYARQFSQKKRIDATSFDDVVETYGGKRFYTTLKKGKLPPGCKKISKAKSKKCPSGCVKKHASYKSTSWKKPKYCPPGCKKG